MSEIMSLRPFSDFCTKPNDRSLHSFGANTYDADSHARLEDLNAANCQPHHVVVHDEINRRYTRFFSFASFKTAYTDYVNYAQKLGQSPHLHEAIRFNNVQRVRFDIDCADMSVTTGEIYELVDTIIAATLEIYSRDYTAPQELVAEDFIICTASDLETAGSQKHSVHILTPIYGATSECCRQFFNAVLALLRTSDSDLVLELIDTIDLQVHKTNQNFRLPLSSKIAAPKRIKRLDGRRHYWDDALVGFYDQDPVIHIEADELPAKNAILDRSITAGMSYEGVRKIILAHLPDFDDDWQLRCEKDGAFYFNRVRPSYCKNCDTTHHKDNTFFITIGSSESHPVYMRCRHAKKAITIGHLNKEFVGELKEEILARTVVSANEQPTTVGAVTTAAFPDAPHHQLIFDDAKLRPFPSNVRTLYVRAQMKMGKTNELINFIDRTRPRCVVFVSFRITFTSSVIDRLSGSGCNFERYSDIKERISLSSHPYIIIQVDSLHRLDQDMPIDLLVLDESESVLAQFTSPHIKNISLAFSRFKMLLIKAARLIAMDANLGERTFRVISKHRPAGQQLGIKDSMFYHATHQNATADTYLLTTSVDALVRELHTQLHAGKKIAFVSNSLETANAVFQSVENKFQTRVTTSDRKLSECDDDSALRVGYYSAKTSPTLRDLHFKDVSRYWGELDLLIYTPTVTAGISFELKHFDLVFGYFTSYSCDVETCRQMLGRIRDVGDHTYYICLNTALASFPIDRGTIEMLVEDTEIAASSIGIVDEQRPITYEVSNDGPPEIIGNRLDHFGLVVENTRHQNLSRNNFMRRFIDQTRSTGATIAIYQPTLTEDGQPFFVRAELTKQFTENLGQLVVASTPLDDEAFDLVRRAKQGQFDEETIVSSADLHAYTKRQMMDIYEVRDSTITLPFFIKLGHDRQLMTYINIRDFRGCIKWLAAIVNTKVADRYAVLREQQLMKFGARTENTSYRTPRAIKCALAIAAVNALGITYLGDRHNEQITAEQLAPITEQFSRNVRAHVGNMRSSVNNFVAHEFGTEVRDIRQAINTALRYFGCSLSKKKNIYTLRYDVDLYNIYALGDEWCG